MIFFGVFGKFGAIFVTIPDPIVGGVFIVMFGKIFINGYFISDPHNLHLLALRHRFMYNNNIFAQQV